MELKNQLVLKNLANFKKIEILNRNNFFIIKTINGTKI